MGHLGMCVNRTEDGVAVEGLMAFQFCSKGGLIWGKGRRRWAPLHPPAHITHSQPKGEYPGAMELRVSGLAAWTCHLLIQTLVGLS